MTNANVVKCKDCKWATPIEGFNDGGYKCHNVEAMIAFALEIIARRTIKGVYNLQPDRVSGDNYCNKGELRHE